MALVDLPTDARLQAIEDDTAQVLWLSDLLPDGLVSVDAHRMVVFANARAGEILGVDHHSMVGCPLTEALPLTDAEGRSWWEVSSPWVGLHTRKGHRETVVDPGRSGGAGHGPLCAAGAARARGAGARRPA